MRIAQIAPLHEAVPPKFYGGTERVVSYLTDALVDLGHEVTLFASGDSQTKAKLEAAGLLKLSDGGEFAAPTAELTDRHAQFHAEVADGLNFIKPHFNEDMRAGHTNM